METNFMNTENSKTIKPHGFILANMKEKTCQAMKLKNIKFLKDKCLKSMIIYMKMR